jgi:hypothetical protein
MKLWINLTIASVVATSVAAWADVNFSVFGFSPAAPFRKQPQRNYAAELLKDETPSPSSLTVEIKPKQKRVKIHVASIVSSDADQPVTIKEPIVLNNLSLVRPAPQTKPWNRVIVDALVAETGWHGATRIRECDRAVEEKFADGPPTVVECQARESDTVYSATTVRRDEDYRRKSNMWKER